MASVTMAVDALGSNANEMNGPTDSGVVLAVGNDDADIHASNRAAKRGSPVVKEGKGRGSLMVKEATIENLASKLAAILLALSRLVTGFHRALRGLHLRTMRLAGSARKIAGSRGEGDHNLRIRDRKHSPVRPLLISCHRVKT